nr:helix-turn-helix transcriptional regulator [Pantoea sp. AS-PWVM4]
MNINSAIKIDDLARRTGLSKWYFQRMFYRVKNESIASYIRDLKLLKAAQDLAFSEENITSIYSKYGFKSQASFTRSFTKKYMHPPLKFRCLCKNNPEIEYLSANIKPIEKLDNESGNLLYSIRHG